MPCRSCGGTIKSPRVVDTRPALTTSDIRSRMPARPARRIQLAPGQVDPGQTETKE